MTGARKLNEHVYVPEDETRPVTDQYVRSPQEAVDLIVSAIRLGLGWQATGYRCPTGDPDVTQEEYRVTVWREAMSETLPIAPEGDQ